MEIFIIIISIIALISLAIFIDKRNKAKVEEKIKYMGGKIININRCWSGSPFVFYGKGTYVYKIEYYLDGNYKVGYVKFDGMFGAKWKL